MPNNIRARRPARKLAALSASLLILGALPVAPLAQTLQPPTAPPAEAMRLTDILSRAAAFDPAAGASDARIQAAEAGLRQAGVKPNPAIGFDVENFGGLGGIGLVDRTEATVFYEQTLERGDKLNARLGVGRAEVELSRARALIRRLDLLEQVQIAWVEAQSADALVDVAKRRLETAVGLERDVARRVAAARDPVFAGERAKTAVAQAQLDLDRARENARQARARLAAYWGAGAGIVLDPSDYLKPAVTVPGPISEDLPDMRLLIAERDLAGSRIGLERSRAVTDPRLRGGVRYLADGNGVALIIGGSIPLQRYDTNQGAIDKASAERLAAERDIDAWRVEREREISRLIARRASSIAEISRIDRDVLPGARRAADLARDGFNRGGGAFTYLDIAEAERAVLDAEARRIELFKAFHLDTVRLDRLTAAHAPLIANTETR